MKNLENCKILEIGTFTGTSIIHILKELPNSIATTIDRWENYIEYCNNNSIDILENIEQYDVENIYKKNIKNMGYQNRIETLKGNSRNILLQLIKNNRTFDFIYVDGSHTAFDCYLDCELSWNLLSKSGFMGIDDYMYKMNEENTIENLLDKPFVGVNQFLKNHENEFILLFKNYRVFIQKI